MQAVTFSIYQYQRVKNTPLFFGTPTYPLFVRVTHKAKSINFKSHCFDQLLKAKYQTLLRLGGQPPALEAIIKLETDLVEFLLHKQAADFNLTDFKHAYTFYAHDMLDEPEEAFKQYLVNFFRWENMPSIAGMLENVRTHQRADLLLDDLKRLLPAQLYRKMIRRSVLGSPPYLPLLEYCKRYHPNNPCILPAFQCSQPGFRDAFDGFVQERYPDYGTHHPYDYITAQLGELAARLSCEHGL